MGENDGAVREYIENVLAPRIRADGGWVEYVGMEDGGVTLLFRGECSDCHVLSRCTGWIAEKIDADLGVKVRVKAQIRKPFFWDKA